MSIRIVQITKELRDSLEETLDKNSINKVRPYYLGISYKGKSILLPIRGNCPRSYSLSLRTYRNDKRNPGIDFSKMIILDRSELSKYTQTAYIDRLMMKDIYRKRHLIKIGANKTINDYKVMINKKNKGLDLNSDERFLDERSTLRNYIRILMMD